MDKKSFPDLTLEEVDSFSHDASHNMQAGLVQALEKHNLTAGSVGHTFNLYEAVREAVDNAIHEEWRKARDKIARMKTAAKEGPEAELREHARQEHERNEERKAKKAAK